VLASTTNTRYPSHYEFQYYTPPVYPQLTYRRTHYRNALLRITGLPSFFSLASISYALLICPHSPCWPTSRTGCSSGLIHLADLPLIPVAHLRSFLSLTYFSYALLVCHHSPRWPSSRTRCSFVLIRRARLLVRVAHLPTLSLLANISYRLLVGPHSPRWPTSRTRSLSVLILLADLNLVVIAHLPSISSLASISYALIVCPHSPRWPTCTCCLSALILLVIQYLVPVARRPLFSTLAYCSYVSLVGTHSPSRPTAPTRRSFDLIFADLHSDVWQRYRFRHRWPTSITSCPFVLIRCAGPLVRIARLPTFSLLANISYWLLVGPHSPRCPTSPTRCSFDLHFANLLSDVWQKRHIRYQWPTSRTCCSFVLIRRAGLLLRVARLPSFSTLVYCSYPFLV